jgi:hypothetical protein
LKKNVNKVAITRNGANGISVFIPILYPAPKNFLQIKRTSANAAPIQKERKTAEIAPLKPSSSPIPTMSLLSPRPISLPFDRSQINAKGRGMRIAARRLAALGTGNWEYKKDKIIKIKTKESGMILWRKS